MAKQDEYRFNLKFDEEDEDHRRVSEFLNKCGRKKARYIVKAILAYWQLQSGEIPLLEQSERKPILHTSKPALQTIQQNPVDRMISVESERNNRLDQEEAELMRQNYAMLEEME